MVKSGEKGLRMRNLGVNRGGVALINIQMPILYGSNATLLHERVGKENDAIRPIAIRRGGLGPRHG